MKRTTLHCVMVLEFLVDMFETFSRRDCGLILAGFRELPGERVRDQWLRRLEEESRIERIGQGSIAQYKVNITALQRHAPLRPSLDWARAWDGTWRIVSYDLPEVKRRDRQLIWRSLRTRKIGLLQRSVWIWPHPLESIWKEIVTGQNAPETFIGFEADRVFLGNNDEVVAAAWDWEEIGRRHRSYLKHQVLSPTSVLDVPNPPALVKQGRLEREAYAWAFSIDPLLPRTLWPRGYAGGEVEENHQHFRDRFRRRWQILVDHVD